MRRDASWPDWGDEHGEWDKEMESILADAIEKVECSIFGADAECALQDTDGPPDRRGPLRMPKDQQLVMSPAKLFAEWQPVGQMLLVKGHAIEILADFLPVDPRPLSTAVPDVSSQAAEDAMHDEEIIAEHRDRDLEEVNAEGHAQSEAKTDIDAEDVAARAREIVKGAWALACEQLEPMLRQWHEDQRVRAQAGIAAGPSLCPETADLEAPNGSDVGNSNVRGGVVAGRAEGSDGELADAGIRGAMLDRGGTHTHEGAEPTPQVPSSSKRPHTPSASGGTISQELFPPAEVLDSAAECQNASRDTGDAVMRVEDVAPARPGGYRWLTVMRVEDAAPARPGGYRRLTDADFLTLSSQAAVAGACGSRGVSGLAPQGHGGLNRAQTLAQQRPAWQRWTGLREHLSVGIVPRCDGLAGVSSGAGVSWKEALEEGAKRLQTQNKQ